MGACTFECEASGSTAEKAFEHAVQDALWEEGHGGYTGYDEIMECVSEENPFEAMVIGQAPWSMEDDSIPEEKIGKVITDLESVKDILDQFSFYGGYGSEACPAVCVWLRHSIVVVRCYDGATSLQAIPRNPIDVLPSFVGGG